MKNIVIIGIALLLLTSCNKKWCNNHYPCIDSTYINEVTKFDTAYIQMPADTMLISVPFDCPDQQVIYRDGKKETVIKIKDRILTVNAVTFADSVRIVNKYKESKEFKQAVKEVEIKVYKTPRNNYYIIAGLIIFVLFLLRKKLLFIVRLFL